MDYFSTQTTTRYDFKFVCTEYRRENKDEEIHVKLTPSLDCDLREILAFVEIIFITVATAIFLQRLGAKIGDVSLVVVITFALFVGVKKVHGFF